MVPTTPDQIASATARRRFGRHFRGLGAGHKVIGPVEGDKIVIGPPGEGHKVIDDVGREIGDGEIGGGVCGRSKDELLVVGDLVGVGEVWFDP